MNAHLDLKKHSDMTPTAAKLYEIAAARRGPVTVDLKSFQMLISAEREVSLAWRQEVERACRELLSAAVVDKAAVEADLIVIAPRY